MNNASVISRIRQTLASRGVIKGNETATQGYLRFHFNISQSLSSFTFNVLENQGTIQPGERRLAITDMFTITHWGLFIGRCASAATLAPTAAELANAKLYTNNNPLVFSGGTAGAGSTTTNMTTTGGGDNLKSLYNGNLTVTVDRERLIDGYDLMRFYRVAHPAEGAAYIVPAAAATTATMQLDNWQGPNYGMAEVDPEITLNGVGQNDITINAANPTSFAPSGNFYNFACMIVRGIRWQNASKLNA